MADMTLSELAEKMKDIDITVMTTRTESGALAGRPMSNNGDVTYSGVSYYFTDGSTLTVSEIERDPNVGLAYQGSTKLFMSNKFYVFVEGKAELIRDKSGFAPHWRPELDKWFANGIDTPGIVMIKVIAERIKYWDGMEHGQVVP